jgi:hypothetical protein
VEKTGGGLDLFLGPAIAPDGGFSAVRRHQRAVAG